MGNLNLQLYLHCGKHCVQAFVGMLEKVDIDENAKVRRASHAQFQCFQIQNNFVFDPFFIKALRLSLLGGPFSSSPWNHTNNHNKMLFNVLDYDSSVQHATHEQLSTPK